MMILQPPKPTAAISKFPELFLPSRKTQQPVRQSGYSPIEYLHIFRTSTLGFKNNHHLLNLYLSRPRNDLIYGGTSSRFFSSSSSVVYKNAEEEEEGDIESAQLFEVCELNSFMPVGLCSFFFFLNIS